MSDNDFAVIENVLVGALADGIPQAIEALRRLQARLSAAETVVEAAQADRRWLGATLALLEALRQYEEGKRA